MKDTTIKLALLDMYEGTRNLGLQNIVDIVQEFSHYLEHKVYDVRSSFDVPDLSHDIIYFFGRAGKAPWKETNVG